MCKTKIQITTIQIKQNIIEIADWNISQCCMPYTLKGLDPTFCIGVNLYLSTCCFLGCLDLRQMQAMMDTHTPAAVTETKTADGILAIKR